MTGNAPVWTLCEVNPATPEFQDLSDGEPITFMPLETVWPGGHADYSNRIGWSKKLSYTAFKRGDVLVPKITPTFEAGRSTIATTPTELGLASSEVHVVRPRADADARFLCYVFQSLPFLDEGAHSLQGVGNLRRITPRFVQEHKVLRVDRDTQCAIADYLDRETGEIDAMLGKLSELSEHLRLRKATVGSHIFSMGFEYVKLKWLIDEIDERAGARSAELPLLSVSIHHGVQLRNESSSNQKASEDLSNYKVARAGEIVLNRMRAFQGGLGQARVDGLVSPDYCVLRPQGRLSPSWAEYVMRSPEFIALMSQRLRGIGSADQSNVRTPRINVRDLIDLAIPLPCNEEQRRAIGELDGATARVDAMLAKVTDLRALLLERRAALITDVATGRKTVA